MSSARFILKDATSENKIFSNRVIVAWLMMFVLLSLIVVRLYFLQVNAHEHYITLSKDNRIKTLPLPLKRLKTLIFCFKKSVK